MEAGALVRVVSGRSSRLVGCTGTVVSFGRQIEVRLDGSDTELRWGVDEATGEPVLTIADFWAS